MPAAYPNSASATGLVSACGRAGAAAAPYVPTDDSAVLETLPDQTGRSGGGGTAPAARRRRGRARRCRGRGAPRAPLLRPGDGGGRSALRRLRRGRVARRGPRPPAAPAEILVLHGMLRQYRHDFARAHGGLRPRAASAIPRNTEARAWRAAILMVQADYAGARRECESARRTRERAARRRPASRMSTRRPGKARAAYARLAAALARRSRRRSGIPRLDPDPAGGNGLALRRPRRGRAAFPRRAWRWASTTTSCSPPMPISCSSRAAPRRCVPLLKNWARSDTLLLRLALAARALKLPEGEKHARTLGERFADAALRGEKLHLQEEARYPAGPQGRRARGAGGSERKLPHAARAARRADSDRGGARRARPGAPPRPRCNGSKRAASRARASATPPRS